ncbi:MAG: four helix bundle protein [Cyclobacteriaceae bacterium]|nr:four helix bundle protein [Cyclobacteriaceae bacterium]
MTKPGPKYDLEERLINYSLRIIDVVELLPDTMVGNHLGRQLLRSGTSPALNYGEAQGAESRKDFTHKLKVITKELRESSINLRILERKMLLKDSGIVSETRELTAIFVASLKTTQRNSQGSDVV